MTNKLERKEREYNRRERFLVWLSDHEPAYQALVISPAAIVIVVLYLVVFR